MSHVFVILSGMKKALGPVVERHPLMCPNGHSWQMPGTYLVGWDSLNYSGARRMWICQTCQGRIYADVDADLTVPIEDAAKYGLI
jgi:hypothetical protein